MPMSDLQEQFEQLAGRGTRRGADDVIAAAQRAARDEHEGEIPFVTEERQVRRRPLSSLVAAAGLASLLVVGTVMISALTGGGGANSPEGAVRQLANAIAQEDSLAAADVLAPAEVRTLRETLSAAAAKAQQLQVVDAAGSPLRGVDVAVDGLQLSTQSLGDDVAKVTITDGTIAADVTRGNFSELLQEVVRADSSGRADLAQLSEGDPTFLVTVRRDDKWYVSAAYTALEYVRYLQQAPPPDFAAAVDAGAPTPDDAVRDAMTALSNDDWDRLFALAAPDELPLYAYREALKSAFADSPTAFTVDDVDTTSEVSGDTAKVTFRASGAMDGGGTWTWDGRCLSTSESGGTSPLLCVGGDAAFGGLFSLVLGYSEPGDTEAQPITVVQRDGRWYISPVGTALTVLDDAIAHLDDRALYTMLGMSWKLESEATITRGQPIAVAGDDLGVHVYSIEGRAGDEIIGAFEPTSSEYDFYPDLAVYSDDGEYQGSIIASPVTLPRDGTYKVVVYVYGDGGTLTVWDADEAPAEAFDSPYDDAYEEHCEPAEGGGTVCSSSSSGSSSDFGSVTPTSVAAAP
jgi:hypothetical protein